jgi:hypothetical protein
VPPQPPTLMRAWLPQPDKLADPSTQEVFDIDLFEQNIPSR